MRYKLFIDFDGTITDVWMRYYSIFAEFWGKISFDKYKSAKRLHPQDKDLLVFLGLFDPQLYLQYKQYKRQCLESPDYLVLDKLLTEPDSLRKFVSDTDAAILTIRRNRAAFESMLDIHGLSFLKSRSHVLEPNGGKTKLEWISRRFNGGKIVMVGDSEMDLAVGEIQNSFVFIVNTGLREPSYLDNMNIPFTKLDSINCFMELYLKDFN